MIKKTESVATTEGFPCISSVYITVRFCGNLREVYLVQRRIAEIIIASTSVSVCALGAHAACWSHILIMNEGEVGGNITTQILHTVAWNVDILRPKFGVGGGEDRGGYLRGTGSSIILAIG